jgi:hypothetical protein
MMSPDYDASDPTPTTEVQAGNNAGTVQDSCWANIRLRLDPQAMMGLGPRRFVRQSAVAGDVKTFDVGKLFVCSNNQTGTTVIGKLWLEYDIEFFVPQNSPNTDTIPQGTSEFLLNAPVTFTSTVAKALQYDTIAFDPLGVGLPVAGAFTPPAGSYTAQAILSVEDTAAETFTVQVNLYKNGAPVALVQSLERSTVTAAGYFTIPLNGVVNCNGTDTFGIAVTMTGAAGTLTCNYASLLLTLA